MSETQRQAEMESALGKMREARNQLAAVGEHYFARQISDLVTELEAQLGYYDDEMLANEQPRGAG